MSESEEVVESQGAEKYTLVDCITDPALDWVAPEPRGIASALTSQDPRLHMIVEQQRADGLQNWSTRIPGEGERVCSSFAGHDFAMYEFVFKEMGLRLPFSPFAASVLKALQVAPSQLHPNSWSFIMGFEHLCTYRSVRPTLPLFFRIFKIQRKPTREVGRAPRQNWVSLKHHEDVKLFKMFVDSIKDFKERYFIIRPESPAARESLLELEEDKDEQGVARKDDHGQVIFRAVPKFPLSWSYDHFQKEPKEYTTGDADLSPEEMAAFENLKAFVAGFTPGIWTTRKGVTLRDEHGKAKVSPRFINTRNLLKYEMETIAERMLKAKQDEKASRSARGKKKAAARTSQEVRPGTPSVQVIGTSGVGSGTPTSAPRPPPAKRTREEDSPVEDAGMGGCRNFPVPRCFTVDKFFEKYPPEVFETERAAILDQEPEVRRQQHARDMAAMVRMVSSSLVLGDERETLVKQLDTARTKHERAKGRINQLELVVDDLREKQKHWGDQLDEHRKRGEDLDAARAEIERLNAVMAPGENEHKAAEGLTTRADLVKVIAQLSHDFVEGTEYAFENAVQQIKCLNPDVELVTRGMHVNGQVQDGQIVIPAGLADSDEEEDDAEAVFEEGHEDGQDDVNEQEDRELYKHLELFLSYANTSTLVYPSSQPEPPIASWVLGRGTGTMGSFRELSSSSRSSISLLVN
ncbi:unnamed protein product [Trifolium pratense]|uniref:Uncharacterized protein n=1 Tax=Trifolium pratense TaxID=57577 RepID=A0ACB0IC11_TRIPR|nr:unnamed protein product [Trifolium pratense]